MRILCGPRGISDEMGYQLGGGSTAKGQEDDKIWMFQIGHWNSRTQYIDRESGEIKGYDVDVVNAVCQTANKNCAFVYDIYENCWDAEAGKRHIGGQGLMGKWYDACVGWVPTPDRKRTFAFSDYFRNKSERYALFRKQGGSLLRNAVGSYSLAGLSVGFLDGWASDEYCLAKSTDILNFDPVTSSVTHFQDEESLVHAVTVNKIDVAFAIDLVVFTENLELIGRIDTTKCGIGGGAIMFGKNSPNQGTWWNSAFSSLKNTNTYMDICDRLVSEHGHIFGESPSKVCVDYNSRRK